MPRNWAKPLAGDICHSAFYTRTMAITALNINHRISTIQHYVHYGHDSKAGNIVKRILYKAGAPERLTIEVLIFTLTPIYKH